MQQTSFLKSITAMLSYAGIVGMFGLAVNSSQAIEVYKSVGAYGEVKYSQHMPRDAKRVEVIEFRSDGRQVNRGQMAEQTTANQQPEAQSPEAQRANQLEARVKEQEAQLNQENAARCQSLRNNLTNLNAEGRIYEMDADGNRKYLDNREIELKRERMQKAITQYCSGQTT